MQGLKLITVLKGFSKSEITQFQEFINSSYFNKNEKLIDLYKFIIKYYPNFSDPKFSKENVYKSVYKNEKFNLTKFKLIISDLFILLEKYLVTRKSLENPIHQKFQLINYYKEKAEEKLLKRKLTEISEYLDKNDSFTQNYFLSKHILFDYLDSFTNTYEKDDSKNEYLQKKINFLDAYYITSKLEYTWDYLNRRKFINIDIQNPLLENVFKEIEINETFYLQFPLTMIRYYLVKLSITNESRFYDLLRSCLDKNWEFLPNKDLEKIYSSILDYYTYYRSFSTNLEEINIKQFDIYNLFILEKKGFKQWKGFLDDNAYFNITALGIKLKGFDWTLQYLKDFKKYLDSESKESVYCIALALLHRSNNNYDEALKILTQIKPINSFQNLLIKQITLMVYFHTKKYELLEQLIESTYMYIYRHNEMNEEVKTRYSNFIHYLKKIYELKASQEQKIINKKELSSNLEKIKHELTDENKVELKSWLLKQINLLL